MTNYPDPEWQGRTSPGAHRRPHASSGRPERPVRALQDAHARNVTRLAENAPRRDRGGRTAVSISVLLDDASVSEFAHAVPASVFIEDICTRFARGTLVATEAGPMAVEDLRPGDRLRTRDHGFRTLRWVAACPPLANEDDPAFWPLRIKTGALGDMRPDEDLIVTPQFRLLSNHPSCAALFGSPEALAPVCELFDDDTIVRIRPAAGLMFYNLMCTDHEIIEVNGLESETYHPGNFGLPVMSPELRFHMKELMPQLGGDLNRFGRTARPVLRGFEAEALRAG